MFFELQLYSLESTKKFAEALSGLMGKGEVLLLKGELGSGKTTLSRFFINSLVKNTNVSSPTFGIVNVYEAEKCSIWHYDLYRVRDIEEIYELGFDEALRDGLTIIEWPDLIEKSISNDGIIVYLKYHGDSDVRNVEISLLGNFYNKHKEIEQLVKGINDSDKA
jgi:tRNA threonylcarbamoyladenosine biosynthesis protein TsaE